MLLPNINDPSQIRGMSTAELEELCKEIREFIIKECSCNPGHFGSSLGVVELTVAIHYVYNTPYDKLVWDVGHQAYAHKILTGRQHLFHTNRKHRGISGFPKMSESPYDAFGVGHASTSISAALGMAIAYRKLNEKRKVIAVIGDGSMTGGLAFEGLNNAGGLQPDMLVILNDNDMAIDPNVGALREYLTKMTMSESYNKLKSNVWDMVGKGHLRGLMQKISSSTKSAFFKQSNLFEALGFRYFGPINGHDIAQLTEALEKLKNMPGPKLLHVITQKGKGYKLAEQNQTAWHAPGTFNPVTGERIKEQEQTGEIQGPSRYQDVFGETIIELAEQNPLIMGITPAMPSGCSLNMMMEKMPDRTFDVGIAEGHAVTFSAGLAAAGFVPFCNIYSSFMQRAYDNVIHDVALQKLNVVFCLDRGGLVGEDGATHHGAFDLAYFRCVPNMIVTAPMNEVELRNMMYTAQLPDMGPFSIRYPRGHGVAKNWKVPFEKMPIGKAQLLREGNDVAILTIGHIGNATAQAIDKLEGITATHYNMRFLKPIDEVVLHEVGKRFTKVITIENGTIVGGLGSAVTEFFAEHGYKTKVKRLGLPDRFVEQGSVRELHKECGIDTDGIYNSITEFVKESD